MTKVALFGAGGKMGVRLSKNLARSDYQVAHVEISSEGRERLKSETGLDCVDPDQALRDADIIVLAVPDRLIGKILHGPSAMTLPTSLPTPAIRPCSTTKPTPPHKRTISAESPPSSTSCAR
jgi:3-hydroxyisobutyrate dehydrogenase-like beta-hydroxyacid dehydrogenase